MQKYLVGGAVRDELLGISSSDRDYVVVGATKEQMLSLGFTKVGADFPVFLHPETNEEYALARTERKSGHGYNGFICDFGTEVTLEDDLLRRDLTINAIAKDEEGNYHDPYHGMDDLKNKVLRHISDAFCEDPLRVLRVARFHARFYHMGFTIADETMALMQKMVQTGELAHLTAERVFLELEKALNTQSPHIFISTLRRCGALSVVMPEIDRLFGIPAPAKWHPEVDTGEHILLSLKTICAHTASPVVRFAELCHDIGKGETPKELWPRHTNHAQLGLKPLKSLCERLKAPTEYAGFAKLVVQNHSMIHYLYKNGAEGIVSLFDRLDAQRKPQRIEPFILCCKCDYLGRLGFENRPFPRYEYFLKMFEIYQSVTAKDSVNSGFKGKDIALDMFKRRTALIEEYLSTLPYDEINE